jgi:peptide/nickel transport system substrate-binding protein
MPNIVRSLAATTALCVVAAGCSGGSSSEPDAAQYASAGTFTMALRGDPATFDPYHSQLIFATAYLAYDPLVHVQPGGKVVGGLAEKWDATPTSATFTLREGVTCSDGTPLTAAAVAKAISYVVDAKNKSPQYGVNTPTVPLTATGEDATRTVKVSTKSPFGFLLNTIGQLPIMCAKGLADRELLKTRSDGTGPFVLTEVVPGQSYTFTVRDGYTWGPGGAATSAEGTPAKVVLRVIENETTAANLLTAGEVSFAQITGQDQQRLDAAGLGKIDVSMAGAWLWLNHAAGRPTAELAVRKALAQALDLNEVVKVNTGGTGKASAGLVAMEPRPCTDDTVAGQLPGFDRAVAERSLDEAGWAKGTDGVRVRGGKPLALDVHYPSGSPNEKATAELLAQRWGAVGARVKLTPDSRAELGKVMFSTGAFDVYVLGFGFILPNQMVPYLSGPKPPEGVNLSAVDNKEFTSLAATAAAKLAPEACTDWKRAEQALYRDIDIIPVADRPNVFYLRGAEAASSGFQIPIPTSLRVLG